MRLKIAIIVSFVIFLMMSTACTNGNIQVKEELMSLYGDNNEIMSNYNEDLAVTCNNGTFIGTENQNVLSYKGIPYAEKPTGDLRWKPSQLAKDSTGIYEAHYFGKSSIQTEAESERASYYPQGEDCLYLNIWSNRINAEVKKPVMVFIHGGSYGWGGTSDPLYDGHNFIAENDDVILVTVGYRTGIMGFIDFSEVEGGDEYQESGNLGLLDQITALQWIQKNIENFGGDPNNVTIFGESAGGGSVSLLSVMPQAEGLFKRVIAQSGSIALTYSNEECQPLTEKLLSYSNMTTMEELLSLTEDELKKLNEKLNAYNNFPQRDGVVLPENLYELYQNGNSKNIDIMIGTNADEARYWINELGGESIYRFAIPVLYENNKKRINNEDMRYVNAFFALQEDEKVWNLTEFYNEVMFRIPAIEMAEWHANNSGNAYMYYWTYPSELHNLGACHAVELAYVFNNLDQTIYTGNNIDSDIAKTVQEMWVNFAKTGDPSTKDLTWDKYDITNRMTMIIDKESYQESDPLAEQRILLRHMNKYNFNGCYTNLSYAVPSVYRICLFVIGIPLTLVIATLIIKKRKARKQDGCFVNSN